MYSTVQYGDLVHTWVYPPFAVLFFFFSGGGGTGYILLLIQYNNWHMQKNTIVGIIDTDGSHMYGARYGLPCHIESLNQSVLSISCHGQKKKKKDMESISLPAVPSQVECMPNNNQSKHWIEVLYVYIQSPLFFILFFFSCRFSHPSPVSWFLLLIRRKVSIGNSTTLSQCTCMYVRAYIYRERFRCTYKDIYMDVYVCTEYVCNPMDHHRPHPWLPERGGVV